jgi:hypothetical protein
MAVLMNTVGRKRLTLIDSVSIMRPLSLLSLVFFLIVENCVSFQKNCCFKRCNTYRNVRLNIQKGSFSDEKGGSFADIINSSGISLGAGVGGIFVLLANRLSVDLEAVTDVQSRADIISVIACSALLLNVLSAQDIVARERDAVPLVGFALKEPVINSSIQTSTVSAIKWIIDTVLSTVPVTSVHVIFRDSFVGIGGVTSSAEKGKLGAIVNLPKMPILSKTLNSGEEIYLPDLQILPGKVEFTYLPINCQSVLILPLPDGGAVVMATNKAKVLKLNDLNKIRSAVTIFRNLITN